jgi:hypothetical protein
MAQKAAQKGKKTKPELFPRPHISRATLRKLEAAEPNYEVLERIKNMVKLKVVDGSTCGF